MPEVDVPSIYTIIFLAIAIPVIAYFLVTLLTPLHTAVKYVVQYEDYLVNVTNSTSNSILNVTDIMKTYGSMADFLSSLLTNKIFIIVLIIVGVLVVVLIKVKIMPGGGGYYY